MPGIGDRVRRRSTGGAGAAGGLPATRLLFALFLLLAGPATGAFAQVDQVRQMAAYSQRVNGVAARFGELINRTMEYDNLAYGVVDGQVGAADARRQVGELSPALWADFERLNDELAAVPEPPVLPDIRKAEGLLRNVRDMARAARDSARDFIESGEKLVEAALLGDPSVLADLETRELERIVALFGQQIALYEVQIAYATEGAWNYHLDGAVKTGLQALVLMVQATLQAAGEESFDTDLLDAERVKAEALIRDGLRQVAAGRASADKLRRQLAAAQGGTAEERRLTQVLVEIFDDNLPQAFDVEARALATLSEFVARYGFQSDQELEVFFTKYTELESERARLVLERQRRIAELQ